jgi:hypothetical protein
MLIETTATEASRFRSQYRSSVLTGSRKKKDFAIGNKRFFVGQWSAKAPSFATDAKAGAFALLIAI